MAIDALGILGLEHQAVEPDRESLDLGAARASVAEAQELEVIGGKDRQMVARTERVMAARRQLEAERGEGVRRLVHPVANIDDDMIENRRGQRHGPPSSVALRCATVKRRPRRRNRRGFLRLG